MGTRPPITSGRRPHTPESNGDSAAHHERPSPPYPRVQWGLGRPSRAAVAPIPPSLQQQEAGGRMAVQAYVLIQTAAGKAAQGASEVAALTGVTSAAQV